MNKLHTHYDNLKVAREAPPEVIRAAYRALSQRFHPDRNPGNDDAARIMTVINTAYAVLSDPERRRQHDEWIREEEYSRSQRQQSDHDPLSSNYQQATAARKRSAPREDAWGKGQFTPKEQPEANPGRKREAGPEKFPAADQVAAFAGHILKHWYWYAVGVFLIWGLSSNKPRTERLPPLRDQPSSSTVPPRQVDPGSSTASAPVGPRRTARFEMPDGQIVKLEVPSGSTPEQAQALFEAQIAREANRQPTAQAPRTPQTNTASSPPSVTKATPLASTLDRTLVAPNGQPWPTVAAYVSGYPRLNNKGRSSVIVDNSQNDSAVFVKLVSIDVKPILRVRHFYIPAHSKFSAGNVTAGTYDVRYQDLKSGRRSRTESFTLTETAALDGGTHFTRFTMTLYKVAHGNMQMYDIAENDF